MDITSIGSQTGISSLPKNLFAEAKAAGENRNTTFEAMYDSAVSMLKETQAYTDAAEDAEISYAMGLTNNTHDVQIAQAKANISLQYTVAIRNAVLDAYKEIMQIQF